MISRQILFIYKQNDTYTNNTIISGKTGGPGGKPLNDQHIEGHETIQKIMTTTSVAIYKKNPKNDCHIGSHVKAEEPKTATSAALKILVTVF